MEFGLPNLQSQKLKQNMKNLNLPSPSALNLPSNVSLSIQKRSTHNMMFETEKQVSEMPVHKHKKYKKKQKPLTQEQIQVFRQAFQIFDSNHSGSIDESELMSLMSALGFDYNQQQIKHILEEVDEDGSGVIEIDQFVEFMSKHMLDTQNLKKQMRKVFAHFDDDGSGFLDFKKIKVMASECFFNLDDDAIHNMIKAADTDGDLKINEYQFFRIMKKVKLI